ncbi:hypothetical protein [Flavobacterium akiainvivens]|nr:hypothetical protein [Flavobacterium akiainvivens]
MKKGLVIAGAITGGIGIVTNLVGYMFKIMHWPGAFEMRLVGGVLLGVGALLIVISLFKGRA